MKKLATVFKRVGLLFLSGIVISSCSKDDGDVKESFSWSLNGKNFTAGTGAHASRMPGSSEVVINGFTNGISQLQISLENCDKVGTYTAAGINTVPSTAFLYLQVGNEEYSTSNNGFTEKVVINVTRLTSGNIQGNFNGTVHSVTPNGAGPAYSLKGEFNLVLWQ